MQTALGVFAAGSFRNACQITRVVTEKWAESNLYCPACPATSLDRQAHNTPATDFICGNCKAPFQLKATRSQIAEKIVDAGYAAMIRALAEDRFPHLFVMRYDVLNCLVRDLLVVPRYFLSESAVEKRKPLGPLARRAGWVGCNIVLAQVPQDGRISLIREGVIQNRVEVRRRFASTQSMREIRSSERGWTLDVLSGLRNRTRAIVDGEFSIADAYGLEAELAALHPMNRHVRPKIRQQLQVLRDLGFLDFVGRGRYRLRGMS